MNYINLPPHYSVSRVLHSACRSTIKQYDDDTLDLNDTVVIWAWDDERASHYWPGMRDAHPIVGKSDKDMVVCAAVLCGCAACGCAVE